MRSGLLSCCLLGGAAGKLNPIVIKGSQLFDIETKQRFFVKGIDYHPDFYANVEEGGTSNPVPPGTDLIANDRESYWTNDLKLLEYATAANICFLSHLLVGL